MKRVFVLTIIFLLSINLYAQTEPSVNKQKKYARKFPTPITLTLWHNAQFDQKSVMDECIADFQKMYPSIIINTKQFESNNAPIDKETNLVMKKSFSDAMINGGGPDLIIGSNSDLEYFIDKNLIIPVTEVMDKVFFNDFTPLSLTASSYNGKIYMIPYCIGNALCLIYNKALVSAAPETWDNMVETAEKLRKEWKVRYAVALTETEPYFSVPMLGAFEGTLLDDDASSTATLNLNTPQVKDWMEWLYQIHPKGQIPEHADYDDANTLFKEGKVAFIINGPWSFINYSESYNLNIGIAPIPKINGKWPVPYYNAIGYTISQSVKNNAERRDACRVFLEYMTSKDILLRMAYWSKMLPSTYSALKDKEISGNPLMAGQLKILEKGKPFILSHKMRAAFESIRAIQKKVVDGTLQAKESPSILQREAESVLTELNNER